MKTQIPFPLRRAHRSERGIVLVMTLALLAVATLLVVAFATVMRVENIASANYRYSLQARQEAEAGLAEALLRLHTSMPEISANDYYVTMPGRVQVRTSTVTGLTNLYSIGTGGTVDLNADSDIAGTMPIGTIQAQWVVVTNRLNRLVGRYAFWVDDEASKININAAFQRTIPLSPVTGLITPAEIDLNAVGANPSLSYSSSLRPYPTTRSWPASGAIGAADCTNKIFNLTAYSTDTKLTPWGEPCFNLNTNITDVAERRQLVQYIADNYFQNFSNWGPWYLMPARTFSNRYGNALQIAANIVDFITPLPSSSTDLKYQPTSPPSSVSDLTPPEYLGLRATPYLNEIAISNNVRTVSLGGVPPTNETTFTTTVLVELWHMYPAPAVASPVNAPAILRNLPVLSISTVPTPVTGAAIMVPCKAVNPSSYAVMSFPLGAPKKVQWVGAPPTFSMQWPSGGSSGVVTGIYRTTTYRMDYAVVPMQGFSAIPAPATPGETNVVIASACNDPRVKPVSTNWVVVAPGVAGLNPTLGSINTGVFNPAVGDGDTSCHIGPKGRMDSLGELGYIHTGLPWRTLNLGPQPAAERTAGWMPDWLVLDMFAVTNGPVPGRININDQIIHGGGVSASASPQRQTALTALLSGTPIAAAATNIQSRTWATGGYRTPIRPGWAPFGTNCFTMIGQICEVNGVAAAGATKSEREAGIRAIANLITTRSDTFTVWIWGQSIWDINRNGTFDAGTDQILSEARLQAVVQRSTNNNWRVLYQRWVTP